MSSIDSLNFDVILNDSAFKKAVADNTALARKFNTDVSRLLSVQVSSKQIVTSKGVDNARNMLNYLEQIRQKILSMPKGQFLVGDADALNATLQQILPKMDALIGKTGSAKAGFSGMNASLSSTNALMRALSQLTGAAFSVVGLRRFLSSLIDITGQFEVQRMALRNMLRDIDGADKIFEDLYRFSSDSTYRFSELAKYAKQLAAFNIDQNNLLETTKMLGDVASGVGVSMDRLILAYGHVKSSGFLRGIQLRSFSQNGVPILDELAKMFSELENRAVSLGEVFDKMTKREIPFAMVEQAFRNMTSEGGKFYQMQEVLAKTLAGQINILKGRWENMLAAVGQANSGPIKDLVSGVSNLISNYENVGRVLKELIVTYGAYRVALFTVTAVSDGLFAATFNLRLGLEKLGAAILRNPYALLAAAIAATGYTIYKMNTYLSDSERITNAATEGVKKYEAAVASEEAEMERLYARLKLAKEGTEEYNKAKLAIENRFGPYLKQIRAEQGEISNLADTYKLLAEKVRDAQKAKFLESESDSVNKLFQSATNNIYESFKKTADVNKWSIEQQEDIWRYIITGELSNSDNKNRLKQMGGGTIGLPGTFLYKDLGRSAASLRASYMEAAKAYDEGMDALEAAFARDKKAAGEGGGDSAEAMVYKIGSIVEGIKKYDADIKALREKAKTAAGITADEKQQLDNLITARKEQTDLYKSIMGVDYDKDTKHEETAAEKARKAEISDLKTNISLLEKYLSIYEKIEPIKGEKTAKWMADTIGGKPEDYKNLEGQIEALCASLRQLGDEGKEAADAVEGRLGLDAASKLVKQFKAEQKAAEDAEKALNKYLESMEKWAAKESALEGTGVGYKIRKAIADYKNDSAKANTAFWENSVLAGAAYGANPTAQAREIGRIMSLWARDKAGAAAKLKNTISGLADDVFKDALKGYDLSHWNDKTLAQIQEIKEVIESIELPEEIKELLKDYPDILAELEQKLKEQKDKTTDNTVKPEEYKKIIGYTQKAANYLSRAAASMKELADASGNTELASFAEMTSMLSETLSSAAAGAQIGGAWGAIIGAGLSVIEQLIGAFAKVEQEISSARKEVELFNSELIRAKFAEQLKEGVDSIFGENLIREMRNAANSMDTLKSRAEELRKKFFEVRDAWIDSSVRPTSGGGGQSGAQLDAIKERLREQMQSWEDLKYVWTPEGDFWSTPIYDLRTIAEKLNMELYDKFGNPNAELLREVMKILGIEGGILKDLADYSDDYVKAVEQMKSVTESLFNSFSTDLTDKFIENYKEMGNAVDDLGETFEHLGETILKSLLNSYILDNILDKYKDEATQALASYSSGAMSPQEYANWLAGFTARVQDDANRNADAINGMIEAFANGGLIGLSTESSGQSLGEGIKGITEETASLLASYINAMRADLSFMRALQEKGWGDVALIGGYVPTLNDYLQQIAANTYNNAQSAARILSELQAVIGSPDTSGQIVRVQVIP